MSSLKRTVIIMEGAGEPAVKRARAASVIQKRFKQFRSNKFKRQYGQVGPEIKYLDTSVNLAFSATASVTSLNTMAQGLTNITRVGNKINIKSIECKILYDLNMANDHQQNYHRVAIVLDKEPEAAAAASYNQVYTANLVTAFRNIGESDRFVVLGVKEFGSPGSGTQGPGLYNSISTPFTVHTIFRKVDIATKYTGTTAAQSAFGTNQLLLLIQSFSDDANADMTINCRIRFTDE